MTRFVLSALLFAPATLPPLPHRVGTPGSLPLCRRVLTLRRRGPGRRSSLDRLQVTVFREPDLSVEDVQVDEGGRVLLPLVGPMTAAGESTETLASEIAGKLKEYIRAPQVAVSVKQAAVRA